MNEEVKLKVNVPLFEEKELEIFDNNIHNIIEEYSKLHLEKREQILTQRIIIKQEEKIKKYKEVLDKIKEEIDNLGMSECNIPNYIICISKINELLEEIK